MKILSKQKKKKKHKHPFTVRSISILWLIAYLFNSTFLNVDTNNFTLSNLMCCETNLTDKNNYEVKNDYPCEIKYKDLNGIGSSIREIKFDNNVTIKNKFYNLDNGQESSNDLTISTNVDSAFIGSFINYANNPIFIPNIIQKVISKKAFDVYYINMIEKTEHSCSSTIKVIVVFKNGKINVLTTEDFIDITKEKDKKLKKIKELIMKNEIANFFDSTMFTISFKGLKKIEGEKDKLNTIITGYKNSTLAPNNISKNLNNLNEENFNKFLSFKNNFKSALNMALFENGNRINSMCDGYVLTTEKPKDIIERYSKEKIIPTGYSYKLKDMIFSYSATNPQELLEVVVKKPILHLADIDLIGANFNEIESDLEHYILGIENVYTDKGEIKIVKIPVGWSLIVDANGIIKSGVYHSDAYNTYRNNRGDIPSSEKLKLYDKEIKDFSLYE